MYGVMLYDIGGKGQDAVSFGNKASIVETRTNNRIQPIHFGVNYHASPLEFKLVFGTDHALDRYDLENISLWLTGSQKYQWLSIDQPDMLRYQFRCIITELTPIFNAWLPVAFEAKVVCDCPYAYGFEFKKDFTINGETKINFRNEGSVKEPLKPNLQFVPKDPSSLSSISIVNKSDGDREFKIENIPTGDVASIDNTNGIITSTKGNNLYGGFNKNFFRLVHGDNLLTVVGDGTLTVSGRFLYNVAG